MLSQKQQLRRKIIGFLLKNQKATCYTISHYLHGNRFDSWRETEKLLGEMVADGVLIRFKFKALIQYKLENPMIQNENFESGQEENQAVA